MTVPTAQYVLWIIAPVLHLVVAALMVLRSLHRRLPWFFVYTIFHIVQFVALFSLFHLAYAPYFYAYWISEGIDCLLVLAVIQEFYQNAFQSFEQLREFAGLVFRWGVLLLIAIAFGTAMLRAGTEHNRLIAGLVAMERIAGFVQCGLLLLLFLLKHAAGLSWRQPAAGFAWGIAVVSASTTAAFTVRALSTNPQDWIVSSALTVSYDIALCVWILTILRPSQDTSGSVVPGDEVLQRWNSSLAEIMGRREIRRVPH